MTSLLSRSFDELYASLQCFSLSQAKVSLDSAMSTTTTARYLGQQQQIIFTPRSSFGRRQNCVSGGQKAGTRLARRWQYRVLFAENYSGFLLQHFISCLLFVSDAAVYFRTLKSVSPFLTLQLYISGL